MADLTTTYMGLALRNPLVAGSSSHTTTLDRVKRIEDAGAGAVVLKSIFEEQIRSEVAEMYDALEAESHWEADQYLRADLPMQMGPEKYLERIETIKAAVGIPVIASVNCTTSEQWTSFARKIEVSGADALEVNIYDVASRPDEPGAALEERHHAVLQAVKEQVTIPVAVKLAPFYSSIVSFCRGMAEAGADGLVLFNRFFQPDIDIESLKLVSRINLSTPEDIRLPLRWIALLRDQVSCSLALTSGVHDAEGLIKAILAGADSVQVCSVLYRKDVEEIGTMLEGLSKWMDAHGFASVSDFRGQLRATSQGGKPGFERAQYVRALIGIE